MSNSHNNILLNINGKKLVFDLSKIKNTVSRAEMQDNQNLLTIFDYFNYYDTEENPSLSRPTNQPQQGSIFGNAPNDEMEALFEELQLAAGSDNCLDTQEAEDFLLNNTHLKNVSAEDLLNFISRLIQKPQVQDTPQQTVTQNNTTKTDAETRQDVIKLLQQDSKQTLELLESQNPGAITKAYNNVKEFFNCNLSNAKVYEAAINEAKASQYLDLVQNGQLTRREYIESNKNRLKDMIKSRMYRQDKDGNNYITKYCSKNGLNPASFEKMMLEAIDYEYDNTSIEQIKNLMRQLSLTTDGGDNFILNNIKEKAIMLHGRQSGGAKNGDKVMGASVDSASVADLGDEKPLTFEEVFEYEHGVPYNKEACDEYQSNYNILCRQIGAYNKYISFLDAKNGITQKDDAKEALDKMVQLFESYYQVDGMPDLAFSKLKEIVKQNNIPINVNMSDGKIGITVSIGSEDLMRGYVDDILNAMQKNLEECLKSCVGENPEKIIQEQGKKVNISHLNAYGGDLSSVLAKELLEDNNSFIKSGTGLLKEGGMYLSSVGGMLCMSPAAPVGETMVATGGVIAVAGLFVDGLLSAVEANTRAVQDSQEQENVMKDIITDAGGMIVGYFASKAGFKAFNQIIDKKLATVLRTEINNGNKAAAIKTVFSNKKTLLNFLNAAGSKISVDTLLSYTGDLVMMGVLDTNQDWESLLKANLMGAVIGTTTEMSAFAKTTSQSQAAKAKSPGITQILHRQIDDAKTKASDYIADKKSAIVSGFNENKTVKNVKEVVDKTTIIAKLNLQGANPEIRKIIEKLCDYNLNYSQLKQIADMLQSDLEYTTKEAQRLRQGDGIRKPELEREFKYLPDFLDRFVYDPSFPLTELTQRRGELTDLVKKVLADSEFPMGELPLLLDSQMGRRTCLGWEAAIDTIKNENKSNLLKGKPPAIEKSLILKDISKEFFTKEDLALIQQLVNDTTTDATVLSTIYKSIEFARLGAKIPKVGNIIDKTDTIKNLAQTLRDLDNINVPEKYKTQVAQLKQNTINHLKTYLENAISNLKEMDSNTLNLYQNLLNEFDGQIGLPISKTELENLKQIKGKTQRYDTTSAVLPEKRMTMLNEELDSVNYKVAQYLTDRLKFSVLGSGNKALDKDLRYYLRLSYLDNMQSKQEFSHSIIDKFLKDKLDKIPNFDLQAEFEKFNKKFLDDDGNPMNSQGIKNNGNGKYPYFHQYLIDKYKYKLDLSDATKCEIHAHEEYYTSLRINMRNTFKTNPEFEHVFQQFQKIKDSDHIMDYESKEEIIRICKELGKYVDLSKELSAIDVLYMKEDWDYKGDAKREQDIQTAQQQYAQVSTTAINNLKDAMDIIMNSLK